MALCLGIIALSGCGSESPAGENEIEIPWEDGSDLSVAEEAMKEVAGEDGTLKEEAKENGNAGQAGDTDVPEAADTPAQAAVPEWDGDFEAFWIAYWDGEDYIKKLQDRGYGADIFCMFEAMFDGEYKLYLEDSVKEQYDAVKAKAKDKKYYLTFVNDVVTETGSEQKDTDVLYAVLKDPAGHAGDVVKLAKDNGFDGVEIDYEKIRKDLGLWDLFIAFENELIKQASDAGLEVRIVLESSTPVSQISLPKGPEYVVMCYNLYGYGTEPGPKADRGFLEDIVRDFVLTDADPTKMQFTIITKEDSKPIGRVQITNLNREEDSLEIYRIYIGDESNRRKGYGRETIVAVLEYAFINMHLERVSVNHFIEDDITAAFCKSLGFKTEGIARSAYKKNGKYHDMQMMSLLRSEFFENRR